MLLSHSSTQSFEEKSEESPDSKPKSRHAENQNLWATYFKNNRNEKDLIKDFPALILKKKTVYNNFEKLRTKGIIIRKIGSGRKSRLTNDLEIKISQILSDDSDLDVSEIKDELCKQGIEVNQRKFTIYLRKMNYEHKLTINDMMNLTADHMNARFKWCQSYKNQNWDLVIFSDETVFSDFRKRKKKWVQKSTVYRAPKTGKGKHKVNAWVAISRTEKTQLELFTYNMDTNAYLENIKKNIKVLRKMCSKKLVLVWDNAPTHVSNKAKEFYLKNRIKRIEWPARSPDLNPIENIWGIVKNELDKRKVNKRVEIIEAIQEISKELDQDIIRNCADSMTGRILKWIKMKGDKTGYELLYKSKIALYSIFQCNSIQFQ